jgi:predicted PurR-regulated permease PerM
MPTASQFELTRATFIVLIIVVLTAGSAWTLWPFVSALIWATTIVVPTWPLLLRVQRGMGGSRTAAATVMTVTVLALFVVPLGLAVGVLLDAAVQGVALVRAATRDGLPLPPSWLESIPLVGPRAAARWQELAAGGSEAVADALRPFVRSTATWAVAVTGGFALVAVHFVLTVALIAILYSKGETAARGLILFGRRIGRERGERTLRLAAQALRGVALGVIVTALVQSVIAGLGLWGAGVPRPGLLLAVVFVLCVAQLGPLPVLVPAIFWVFSAERTGWGIALTAVTVFVAVADNVLKPVLIRRGADLPLLLIVAGVLGGLIGFGVAGLFIGPVLLAVTFTLLEAWVHDDSSPGADRAHAPPTTEAAPCSNPTAAAPR